MNLKFQVTQSAEEPTPMKLLICKRLWAAWFLYLFQETSQQWGEWFKLLTRLDESKLNTSNTSKVSLQFN